MQRKPKVADLRALKRVCDVMNMGTNKGDRREMTTYQIVEFLIEGDSSALVLFGYTDFFIVHNVNGEPEIIDGVCVDAPSVEPVSERVLKILLGYTLLGIVPTGLLELIYHKRETDGSTMDEYYDDLLQEMEAVLEQLS